MTARSEFSPEVVRKIKARIMVARGLISGLQPYVEADQVVIDGHALHLLLQFATAWCDVTEEVWLGSKRTKH